MTGERGSFWVAISGAEEGLDAYPTNGFGGVDNTGVNPITTSYMATAASWSIDSIIISTTHAADTDTLTFKDADGDTLFVVTVAPITTIPHVVDFGERGMLIKKQGGFSVNSSDALLTVFVLFSIHYKQPS